MARGRHVRRSGLLARLLPSRRRRPSWRDVHARALLAATTGLHDLQAEVVRLRSVESLTTAAAVQAALRAQRLERQLAAARSEAAALRVELAGLREELVWAFAERKLEAEVEAAPPVVTLAAVEVATA